RRVLTVDEPSARFGLHVDRSGDEDESDDTDGEHRKFFHRRSYSPMRTAMIEFCPLAKFKRTASPGFRFVSVATFAAPPRLPLNASTTSASGTYVSPLNVTRLPVICPA